MSKFKRKKIGIARKFLIKIGKKLVWWKASKANALVMNGTYLFLTQMFYEITNNFEKTNEEWFLFGTKMGRALIDDMFNLAEIMLSKSVPDLIFIIQASWYIFLGQEIISIQYFPPDPDGIEKIVWIWDKCVMCTNAQNKLGPELAKNIRFEACAAGIYQTAIQIFEDHVGNPYNIVVKDTESRARGDPYCELTAFFIPLAKP